MANFCPEVSYNSFHLFASGIYPYHDSFDRDSGHEKLKREGVDLSDPRWDWWVVGPCPKIRLEPIGKWATLV